MKKISMQALACAVIVGLAAPMTAMATNGYFAHGYGTKNKGLAGGGVALPQDAMIAATNPAGMALVGERMDVGVGFFSPSPRSYTATGSTGLPAGACPGGPGMCPFDLGVGTVESDNDMFAIPHIAYNWQLAGDRTAGITIYGNGGMNTEYKKGTASHESGPGTGVYATGIQGVFGAGTGDVGVNLAQLFINASYAVKSGDNRAIGVSLIGAYQRFSAQGVGSFAGLSTDPNSLSNKGTDTGSGFGLKFGVQDEVGPGVSVGASYQTEIKMSKFSKYKGLFAEQGNFDIPATVTMGLAIKPSTESAVTVDWQKIYYSKVPSIANPFGDPFTGTGVFACAGAGGGSSGNPACLGGSNGAGFGWKDMSILKLGYQVTSGSVVYRVGYSKGNQPIASSEVMFNILAPAVIEEHLTFGATMALSNTSEINFAAMYAKNNSVTGPNKFTTDPGTGIAAQDITLAMKQYELEISYDKKF